MISLRTHNVLDYVAGAAVIVLAAAVGNVGPARSLFLVAGGGQIVYSLFTNYHYSILKLIPLGVHMTLDCVAGFALLAGPWIFGYRDQITGGQLALHIVLGAGVLALVAFTNRKTETIAGKARREQEESRVERTFETMGRR